MTERQIQGKRVLVRNKGKFEITEFELAGFNCIYRFTVIPVGSINLDLYK